MTDVKVINGNNRQIDLLAYNVETTEQYHVEVSVTHRENWCPTLIELTSEFDKKYFGVPAKREGKNTDYALGKTYIKQIEQTYESVGLDRNKIKRIWVCWTVREPENIENQLEQYLAQRGLPKGAIEILSFRNDVIPSLLAEVGTSNYEDDVLRTLSFIQQYQKQTSPNKLVDDQN